MRRLLVACLAGALLLASASTSWAVRLGWITMYKPTVGKAKTLKARKRGEYRFRSIRPLQFKKQPSRRELRQAAFDAAFEEKPFIMPDRGFLETNLLQRIKPVIGKAAKVTLRIHVSEGIPTFANSKIGDTFFPVSFSVKSTSGETIARGTTAAKAFIKENYAVTGVGLIEVRQKRGSKLGATQIIEN